MVKYNDKQKLLANGLSPLPYLAIKKKWRGNVEKVPNFII
jgi:hypothetical protein